jgi:hypothetical protein
VELIPKKQVEAVSLFVAEWLRIAFAQFLSSESGSLMGIKDPAEFRLYATDRFRGIDAARLLWCQKSARAMTLCATSRTSCSSLCNMAINYYRTMSLIRCLEA